MGLLPKFQETLIHRALELDDVPMREIMTPRQKIFSLPSNMPVEEASARVIDHMHSRVPVYDETRGPEHIVGVVYSKDLARLMFFRPSAQRAPVRWRLAIMRGRLPGWLPVWRQDSGGYGLYAGDCGACVCAR